MKTLQPIYFNGLREKYSQEKRNRGKTVSFFHSEELEMAT